MNFARKEKQYEVLESFPEEQAEILWDIKNGWSILRINEKNIAVRRNGVFVLDNNWQKITFAQRCILKNDFLSGIYLEDVARDIVKGEVKQIDLNAA